MTLEASGEVETLRSLYIDLLMKSVLGLIYKDADEGAYKTRIEGSGISSNSHTMIGCARLASLRQLAELAIKAGVPGDFIETGIWEGGACILLRGILAAYRITDRCVYLADSFEGLPAPNVNQYPADHSMGDWYKAFATPINKVKDNFIAYGLLDPQVIFVEGWFKDTLKTLSGSRFALIRLDGDLYESTIQALDELYPLLSPGGFIIIDDYGAFEACRSAVEDYRGRHRISEPMQKVDTSSWWRKSKVY